MDPAIYLADITLTPPQGKREVVNLAVDKTGDELVDITQFSPDPPKLELIDIQEYDRMQRIKRQIQADTRYESIKSRANPFEKLGKSGFLNRAALKLASIDAVFQLSGNYSLAQDTSAKPLTFCDVAGGPGSWSQYLQYRHPNSQGFGITLSGERGFEWNWAAVNRDKFTPYYGPEGQDLPGEGDLFRYAETFAEFVREQVPEGVDVCVADGGFEVEGDISQEIKLMRLVLSEVYSMLLCLGDEGNMTVKIFRTATDAMAGLVYILATCFEELYIMKPLASRPNSSEKYIIGLGLKPEIDRQLDLLQEAYFKYDENPEMYLQSLVEVPIAFKQELRYSNNELQAEQIKAMARIAKMILQQPVEIPEYRLDRVLASWAISANR